jgi:hypothetical protein
MPRDRHSPGGVGTLTAARMAAAWDGQAGAALAG